MKIFESVRVALTALWSNKLRAALTMLGIIIGVGAVISMLSIGNGFARGMESQFTKLGSGAFYIYPFVESKKVDERTAAQLTSADAEALMAPAAAPAVETVAVIYGSNMGAGRLTVSAGQKPYSYHVSGVTPNYFAISENELGAGRYFTADEDRDRARVALIGVKVANELFGGTALALGQQIKLNGVSFEVIGVLVTDLELGPNPNPSEWVFVPYQTARSRLFRNQVDAWIDVTQLTVKARHKDQVDEAIAQVTALLRQRHGLTYQNNDFTVLNPEELAATFDAALGGFSAFLGIVAGISLLVGGIGIMNIMLVSVTERTREIGLRKAVGARRWDILQQFLIEAIVLSTIGGALGIALGLGLSSLGTLVMRNVFRADDAQAIVSLWSIVLATVVSAGIGIFFGFFPALRAARLNPIEALRYE